MAEKEKNMGKAELAETVRMHRNAVREWLKSGSGGTLDLHDGLPVPEDLVGPPDENRPLPPHGTSFLRGVGDLRLGDFERNPRRL